MNDNKKKDNNNSILKVTNIKDLIKVFIEYGGSFSEELVLYMPVTRKAFQNAMYEMKKNSEIKITKKAMDNIFGNGYRCIYAGKGFMSIYGLENRWESYTREGANTRAANKNFLSLYFMLCGAAVGGFKIKYQPNVLGRGGQAEIIESGSSINDIKEDTDNIMEKLGIDTPASKANLVKAPYANSDEFREYIMNAKMKKEFVFVSMKDMRESSGASRGKLWETYAGRSHAYGILVIKGDIYFVYSMGYQKITVTPKVELTMLNNHFPWLFEGADVEANAKALFIGRELINNTGRDKDKIPNAAAAMEAVYKGGVEHVTLSNFCEQCKEFSRK